MEDRCGVCSDSVSILRGIKSSIDSDRCIHGHQLTTKTLQVTKKGHRRCRICLAIACAKWRGKVRNEGAD